MPANYKLLRFRHIAGVDNIVNFPTPAFRGKLTTQGRKKLVSFKNDVYSNIVIV